MLKALLVRTQAHLDLAQHAVVHVDHAPPGDGGRIDVQAGKAAALLRRQRLGIGLVDAQFLQPSQHAGRESPVALLVGRAQGIEELRIVLQ